MEGAALGVCALQELVEVIYGPRWRQSFLNPPRGRGRDKLDPGKQDLHYLGMCISVDNIFIVSTPKLCFCFHLALEWEVPNSGKGRCSISSWISLILRGVLFYVES